MSGHYQCSHYSDCFTVAASAAVELGKSRLGYGGTFVASTTGPGLVRQRRSLQQCHLIAIIATHVATIGVIAAVKAGVDATTVGVTGAGQSTTFERLLPLRLR